MPNQDKNQDSSTSGNKNTDRSYIMDGDRLVNPVSLDRLGDTLRSAADKYDSDKRHDRAAGVREAAAAFDQAFRTSGITSSSINQQTSNR